MNTKTNKLKTLALLLCTFCLAPFTMQAQLFWSGTINLTHTQNVTQNVVLTGDVTINVQTSGTNATISGIISAQGGASYTVTKTGGGTLRLTGNNTYTGVTTISEGSVWIGNETPTGAIVGDIVNNSALRFYRSNPYTYNGVISGTGTVFQSSGNSSSVLTLGGVNTYTGLTRISTPLVLSATGSIANSSVVRLEANLAKLDISAGNKTIKALSTTAAYVNSTVVLGSRTLTIGTDGENEGDWIYVGTISGTGGIIKTGTGTLRLTGDNTYTGNTIISQGNLYIGNNTTTGSIAGNIVNNANLYFARTNSYTYNGMISGTGNVYHYIDSPSSILTLGGSVYHTGTTYINAPLILSNPEGYTAESAFELNTANAKLDISAGSKFIKSLSSNNADTEVILGSKTLDISGGENCLNPSGNMSSCIVWMTPHISASS